MTPYEYVVSFPVSEPNLDHKVKRLCRENEQEF